MKNKIILLAAIALISACHQTNHLCKKYSGIIPAADAPGIKTTISFPTATHYHSKRVFIDKKDGTFKEDGRYTIKGNLITLDAPDGFNSYYRIEKGQIRALDNEQQPITGPLADYYVLKCKK